MLVKINETGNTIELEIRDRNTGVNWVFDLIGNAGALNDGQFVADDEGACLSGTNADGLGWETDDAEADSLESAIDWAIEYLTEYNN